MSIDIDSAVEAGISPAAMEAAIDGLLATAPAQKNVAFGWLMDRLEEMRDEAAELESER